MEKYANRKLEIMNEAFLNMPFPVCIVDTEGGVKYANALMKQVFTYDDIVDANFFALTGVKRNQLYTANDEETRDIRIERNEQAFILKTNLDVKEDEDITVVFINVSEREYYRNLYKGKRPCILTITIDNYDELLTSIVDDSRMTLATEVDRCIRKWADNYNAAIERISETEYFMAVYREDADKIIESKFSILDNVREIETTNDFPLSVSIGMGMGDGSLDEVSELAEIANELAMSRGGDQAVVKNGDRTHYYGGKLQSMEKNNKKGKSRIIAHSLKQLIKESSKVLIMGHRWPDMDSFGSAIGIYRICRFLEKDASIVIEEYNGALQEIYRQAKEKDCYDFVKNDKAIEMCDDKTLLVVVDTNKPFLVENPKLLELAEKIVVIDHHRVSDDIIENPTLAYIESYSSSASELVTEIIQYTSTKRFLKKFDAEALLAGITVDTNSFSIKTGVRTFEASAWLRKSGADTTEVKRFFQTEVMTFQAKAEAISNAEYMENGIVIATSEGYGTEAQIINAQVADELLMVKGVKASFVVGKNENHKTVISARSLGDINVQIIMEKFGGGGHHNSAGAQVDMTLDNTIEKIKKTVAEILDENNKGSTVL